MSFNCYTSVVTSLTLLYVCLSFEVFSAQYEQCEVRNMIITYMINTVSKLKPRLRYNSSATAQVRACDSHGCCVWSSHVLA